MKRAIGFLVAASGVVGCQTVAMSDDAPGRIAEPTDASRAALQQVVNAALNTEVLLTDDALTDSSLLVIARKIPQSLDGSPAGGRIMEAPFQFRLVINGDDCILVDLRDDSRHTLNDTVCIAEE